MPSSTGSWKHDGTDMELDEVRTNGNEVRAAEPDGKAIRIQDAPERDGLLSGHISGNGGVTSSGGAAEAPDSVRHSYAPAETGAVSRMKREMNEVVCKKVPLWMVIVFIFILVLIAAVITVSLLVCSAIHEDEDEKFEPSLFTVPLYFNGSFELPNVRDELSAGDSQTLAGQLEQKLAHLFKSSPALGRYFSTAEIIAFRNGSAAGHDAADYQLTFLTPEDERDELRTFTLSRAMVYNVFRQFLYDQDSDPSARVYIEPLSLLVL